MWKLSASARHRAIVSAGRPRCTRLYTVSLQRLALPGRAVRSLGGATLRSLESVDQNPRRIRSQSAWALPPESGALTFVA